MQNEKSKRTHVRFVAAPSPNSNRIKTMITVAVLDDSNTSAENATEEFCATCATSMLSDFLNGL